MHAWKYCKLTKTFSRVVFFVFFKCRLHSFGSVGTVLAVHPVSRLVISLWLQEAAVFAATL